MDYVCNRCLFSIPSKVEMAEEQEHLIIKQLLNSDITMCPANFEENSQKFDDYSSLLNAA